MNHRYRKIINIVIILIILSAIAFYLDHDYAKVIVFVLFSASMVLFYALSVIEDISKNSGNYKFSSIFSVLITFPILYSVFYFLSYYIFGECIEGSGKTGEANDYVYFSYVTWATLGYGDIHPVGMCRFLAVSEAILGYIFLAFLVGYLSVKIRDKNNDPQQKN